MARETLGRLAGDFIASVLLTAEAPDAQQPDVGTLRGQLVRQLDDIAHHPLAQSLESSELDDARFALVAWADETLLGSNWSGVGQWSRNLLQSEIFRTNRGGDEFYERLGRLRPEQNGARQIFFLCLAFGFQGRLFDDESRRRATVQEHYEILRAAGVVRDLAAVGRLSEAAYQWEVHLEPPSSGSARRILLGWAGGTGLFFLALLGILYFLAGRVPVPNGL